MTKSDLIERLSSSQHVITSYSIHYTKLYEAGDAVVIDSTAMPIDEVFATVMELVNKRFHPV